MSEQAPSPQMADYRSHYRKDAGLICDPWSLPPVRAASEARRVSVLVRHLALRPGERLLDIGCGSGHLAECCGARGARVVATDIAPAGVAAARARFPRAGAFAAGDAYAMPLRPASFDVVVLSEVLEHLESIEAALGQACQLLRPTGRLLVTVPCRETIIQHLCIHCNRLTPADAHLHSFDAVSLTDHLQRQGMRVTRSTCVSNKLLELVGFPHLTRWWPYWAWRCVDGLLNRMTGRPAFLLVMAVPDL